MAVTYYHLLTEDGGHLLTEDGGRLRLEWFPAGAAAAGTWRASRVTLRWRAKAVGLTWKARPVSLRWRAGVSQLVDNVLAGQAGDLAHRLVMDLSDLPQVRAGSTIATLSGVTVSPTGPTLSGSQIDTGSKTMSVLFSGGTAGVDYAVTLTCVLSTGETVERTGTRRVVS